MTAVQLLLLQFRVISQADFDIAFGHSPAARTRRLKLTTYSYH